MKREQKQGSGDNYTVHLFERDPYGYRILQLPYKQFVITIRYSSQDSSSYASETTTKSSQFHASRR